MILERCCTFCRLVCSVFSYSPDYGVFCVCSLKSCIIIFGLERSIPQPLKANRQSCLWTMLKDITTVVWGCNLVNNLVHKPTTETVWLDTATLTIWSDTSFTALYNIQNGPFPSQKSEDDVTDVLKSNTIIVVEGGGGRQKLQYKKFQKFEDDVTDVLKSNTIIVGGRGGPEVLYKIFKLSKAWLQPKQYTKYLHLIIYFRRWYNLWSNKVFPTRDMNWLQHSPDGSCLTWTLTRLSVQ